MSNELYEIEELMKAIEEIYEIYKTYNPKANYGYKEDYQDFLIQKMGIISADIIEDDKKAAKPDKKHDLIHNMEGIYDICTNQAYYGDSLLEKIKDIAKFSIDYHKKEN